MRTIKFRGKSLETDDWVYGFLADGNLICTWDNRVNCHEVLSITVGQFTGLLDSNGREIYEGDIVKRTDGYSYIVKYEFGSFYARLIGGDKEDVYRLALFNNMTVIVGNIHDNPDLMKGGKE